MDQQIPATRPEIELLLEWADQLGEITKSAKWCRAICALAEATLRQLDAGDAASDTARRFTVNDLDLPDFQADFKTEWQGQLRTSLNIALEKQFREGSSIREYAASKGHGTYAEMRVHREQVAGPGRSNQYYFVSSATDAPESSAADGSSSGRPGIEAPDDVATTRAPQLATRIGGHTTRLMVAVLIVSTATLLFSVAGFFRVGDIASDAEGTLLREVRERGWLNCGVNGSLPRFSQRVGQEMLGMDADFCRALAAAIFTEDSGDLSKINSKRVKFRVLDIDERWEALSTGLVDVLFRSTTRSLSREAKNSVLFGPVTYFDRLRILVPASYVADDALTLADLEAICVNPGTPAYQALKWTEAASDGEKLNIYKAVVDDRADFLRAGCDAMAGDETILKSMLDDDGRMTIVDKGEPPAVYVLSEIDGSTQLQPFSPVVRAGDEEWLRVVSATVNATIVASAIGVDQYCVREWQDRREPLRASIVAAFLGLKGASHEKAPHKALGLDKDFARHVVLAVGNYHEIYARAFGLDLGGGAGRQSQERCPATYPPYIKAMGVNQPWVPEDGKHDGAQSHVSSRSRGLLTAPWF